MPPEPNQPPNTEPTPEPNIAPAEPPMPAAPINENPPPQSIDAMPASVAPTLPLQPPPELSTQPIAQTQPLPTPPPANKSKLWIVIIVIIVVLLVIVGIYFLGFGKKNTTSSSAPVPMAPLVSTTTPSTTSTSSKMAGSSDTVSTLCYTFTMPAPHDAVPADNSCYGALMYYGKDKVASVAVTPTQFGSKSLADMVAKWKKDYRTYTIVSETNTKLAGVDATKIIYKMSKYSTQSVAMITYNPKYSIRNVPVEGFYIDGMYAADYDSQKSMDSIFASWQWK